MKRPISRAAIQRRRKSAHDESNALLDRIAKEAKIILTEHGNPQWDATLVSRWCNADREAKRWDAILRAVRNGAPPIIAILNH